MRRRLAPIVLMGALLLTVTIALASLPKVIASSPGALEFANADYSVASTAGAVTVTVERLGGSSGVAIATYGTFDDSAVAGEDYSSTFGTLTWADGDQAAKTFSVPIARGGAGGRSFTVALLSASGPTFGAPIDATVMITAASAASTPGAIEFSSASYSVAADDGTVTVTLERVGGSSGAAVATYGTFDQSAVAGTDYTTTFGSVSWADGDDGPRSFTVPIAAAAVGRSFTVALLSAVDATFGTPISASVYIDSATAATGSGADVPPPAAEVGYTTLTFDSTTLGTTAGNVMAFNYYGNVVPAGGIVQNADGTLLLTGDSGNTYGGTLATSRYNRAYGPIPFQGIAFGGGMYLEVVMQFSGVPNGNDQSPGINLDDVESQSGYIPFEGSSWIEMDGPETDVVSDTQYGVALHNWYDDGGGKLHADIPAVLAGSRVVLPTGSTLNDRNTYGVLWVPATATTQGYIKWFFNGQQIGPTGYWDRYSDNQPFPPAGSDIGNIIDVRHLTANVGVCSTDYPTTVYSFRVWQASGADNLVH